MAEVGGHYVEGWLRDCGEVGVDGLRAWVRM